MNYKRDNLYQRLFILMIIILRNVLKTAFNGYKVVMIIMHGI